jgi:hypothetical protein
MGRVHFKLSHPDNRKSLRGFGTGRMPFSIDMFSLTGKTFVGKMLGIFYVHTLPVRASISIESMQKNADKSP